MTGKIAPLQAIGISRLAHHLKAQGGSIVHMECGQSSTGTLAIEDPVWRRQPWFLRDGVGLALPGIG